MTRKHFRIIADIIKQIQDSGDRVRVANYACSILCSTNPNFNKQRFFVIMKMFIKRIKIIIINITQFIYTNTFFSSINVIFS